MRSPTPTAREVRWAFYVVATCGLILTLAISWGIVHRFNQTDEIVGIAASSSSQVDRLSAQLDAQSAQLDALKRQAARDARASARETRALRQQNRALLNYLRELGIDIPRTATRGPGQSSPKGRAPSGAPPKSKPRPSPTPGSPGPTGTPSPTGSPGLADVICGLLPPDVPCLLP